MQRRLSVAQMSCAAAGRHGQHFRDHAERDLLGTVGAEIKADRPEDALALFHVEGGQDLLDARFRTEHANVRSVAGKQALDPRLSCS